jgi:uroporphyrinogen decarboxylase
VDLRRNPGVVHHCLDRLFDLAYEKTRRMLDALPPGLLVLCYVSEDLGSQQGLLISPADIRGFLLPRMRRMVELARKHQAVVFHHDDGAIAAILPDLVELGIQVLNPIQWRTAGMDRETLARRWGDRLVFHGAMDNQRTLPFGTVEEVRAEVRDNVRILGERGGYVLAPCHNLQPITPVENVLALYDAARTAGRS